MTKKIKSLRDIIDHLKEILQICCDNELTWTELGNTEKASNWGIWSNVLGSLIKHLEDVCTKEEEAVAKNAITDDAAKLQEALEYARRKAEAIEESKDDEEKFNLASNIVVRCSQALRSLHVHGRPAHKAEGLIEC